MELNTEEIEQYSRQISLDEIGLLGQLKLRKASVLVVGAGGLGCPVLQYLNAAGVGSIGIVDFDIIQLSNIHRQVLYGVQDLGKKKASTAKDKLNSLNAQSKINAYNVEIDKTTAGEIIGDYDLIIDCCDNIKTRYILNDECIAQNKVMVFAAVHNFEGQVAVLNHNNGPSYRCLFPENKIEEKVKNCSDNGAYGIVTGITGLIQANEVLKIILGIGIPVDQGILHIDILKNSYTIMKAKRKIDEQQKSSENKQAEMRNDVYIGSDVKSTVTGIAEITVDELMQNLLIDKKMQIIDVREEYDTEQLAEIDSKNIPLYELSERFSEIDSNTPLILVCQSGSRSKMAAKLIQQQFKDLRISHLGGGIDALLKFARTAEILETNSIQEN